MVPILDMCRSIISLSRITHSNVMQSPNQPKKQGNKGGGGDWGRGVRQNLKKGDNRQNRRGLHKIGGLGTLC